MKPVIGLTGEIELEKGGPGSGPRPGNGGASRPTPGKRGSAFQRRALKEGNGVMHHGEFKRVVGTSRDGKTVDLQDNNGNTTSGIDTNFVTPIQFTGAGMKDYGNNRTPKAPDNRIRIKGGRPNPALRSNGGTAF